MWNQIDTNLQGWLNQDWDENSWSTFQPYFDELTAHPITRDSVDSWMTKWSQIDDALDEVYSRLHVANTRNTADEQVEKRFLSFVQNIVPKAMAVSQTLREQLVASGFTPSHFEIPLRNMRAAMELFTEKNLPLVSEEQKLRNIYSKITGKQAVEWDGQEKTMQQMEVLQKDPDRSVREAAWRAAMNRQLLDREAINANWVDLMNLRQNVAANAGFEDYRAYAWKQRLRFDYTPEDSLKFHQAIEDVVVPAAQKIYETRRQALGIESVRPWDLKVDLQGEPSQAPFNDGTDLLHKSANIFDKLDPQLGAYFHTMVNEDLLDVENRKNKRVGGYCTGFPVSKRPFIFMNAVGLTSDIRTLLHEAGHAFHGFEKFKLPYNEQRVTTAEFAEVASMAMELLTMPYWGQEHGGFFTPADNINAQIDQLERIILFWPYMAVVDAFQHWVYTHIDEAKDSAQCDAVWSGLWDRFMKGEDWSGFDEAKMTGWHRKQHIHIYPYYYIEYGMAQLGAVQIWANVRQNPQVALDQYKASLALGGTKALPQLFEASGAQFVFDHSTLGSAVDLIMRVREELIETHR